jgi:DNA-binding transcriptional regulator LsrR (DeoR family)
MKRVIGIDLATLKSAPRVVGIAGGQSKVPALLAALAGKWINVLITDRLSAEQLISTRVRPSEED